MQLVLLAAGAGSRFKKQGYAQPKPLVEFHNHPLFWWAAKSALSSGDFDSIHVVLLKEHIEQFSIDKSVLKYFPNAKIHVLTSITQGAAMTVAEVVPKLNKFEPFCAVDCDLAFSFNAASAFDNFKGMKAGLCLFKSTNPAYSYVEFNDSSEPVCTHEKKVVSNDAIAGIYYFSSPSFFLEHYSEYCSECKYSELFLSGIFNNILEKKISIGTLFLKSHISLGTPQELTVAKKKINDLSWCHFVK